MKKQALIASLLLIGAYGAVLSSNDDFNLMVRRTDGTLFKVNLPKHVNIGEIKMIIGGDEDISEERIILLSRENTEYTDDDAIAEDLGFAKRGFFGVILDISPEGAPDKKEVSNSLNSIIKDLRIIRDKIKRMSVEEFIGKTTAYRLRRELRIIRTRLQKASAM